MLKGGSMWRKSSRCDTSACVEVVFVRSSRCGAGDCVEVAFTKASASAGNGNYVEVAFRKATSSAGNGNCVEVGACCGDVLVRDSKDPDGPRLSFGAGPWGEFLDGVRAGQFDRGGQP